MTQPRKGATGTKPKKKTVKKIVKKNNHKQYGTSKLEIKFATEFLDKMGIKYVYQYEMDGIGRFLDFMIVYTIKDDCIMENKDGLLSVSRDKQTVWPKVAIEIDGGYFHSDPRVVDESKLTPMQKHNKKVDKIKDRWCGINHIPLLRIWEYDINNNPKLVRETLEKYIKLGDHQQKMSEIKKNPH